VLFCVVEQGLVEGLGFCWGEVGWGADVDLISVGCGCFVGFGFSVGLG